jgi:uncharacterized protein (TIGR03663 family)
MKGSLTLALLFAAAIGLGLRLAQLGQRPFHTDESVHAIKFLGLWEKGVYRYDPQEYHGPILYYATLPFAWLSGAHSRAELTESTLRIVTVVFGIGLILLLPLLRDGLGRQGVVAAGILTAVSPAFVFYSRYYIHETLLVFFTLLFLGAAWRCWRTGRLSWAAMAGLGLGLMYATKETFVFVLAALGAAAIGTVAWERIIRSPSGPKPTPAPGLAGCTTPGLNTAAAGAGPTLLADWSGQARARLSWQHGLVLLGSAAAVSLVLFTSFFTNASGPADSIRTYLPWFQRAGGASPHVHPWFFYLQRLGWFHTASGPIWSEGLILLLAAVGWGAALWGRKPTDGCLRWLRFLGFYTVTLTAAYSVIGYKTPWCALGFHHGYVLLAGAGVTMVSQWLRTMPCARWATWLLLGAATVQMGIRAWQAAIPYATDRRNPYVYAHTARDLLRLVDKVRAIARVQTGPDPLVIKVMAPGGDYWPLPWYLREFPNTNTGWYATLPADPYASMMIVNARFQAELDEKSEKKWLMVGLFEHRPQVALELYVKFELWKKYIESLPPRRDDD